MTNSQRRFVEGREKRLQQEMNLALHNTPVKYECIYKRPEQANQFKRGWHSVTFIDIDVAVNNARKNINSQQDIT